MTPGLAALPNWSRLASIFSSSHHAPLFIATTAILAETDWLERLAETPHRTGHLGGDSEPDPHDSRRLGA